MECTELYADHSQVEVINPFKDINKNKKNIKCDSI